MEQTQALSINSYGSDTVVGRFSRQVSKPVQEGRRDARKILECNHYQPVCVLKLTLL